MVRIWSCVGLVMLSALVLAPAAHADPVMVSLIDVRKPNAASTRGTVDPVLGNFGSFALAQDTLLYLGANVSTAGRTVAVFDNGASTTEAFDTAFGFAGAGFNSPLPQYKTLGGIDTNPATPGGDWGLTYLDAPGVSQLLTAGMTIASVGHYDGTGLGFDAPAPLTIGDIGIAVVFGNVADPGERAALRNFALGGGAIYAMGNVTELAWVDEVLGYSIQYDVTNPSAQDAMEIPEPTGDFANFPRYFENAPGGVLGGIRFIFTDGFNQAQAGAPEFDSIIGQTAGSNLSMGAFSTSSQPVPEPGSILLVSLAIGGLAWSRRRRAS